MFNPVVFDILGDFSLTAIACPTVGEVAAVEHAIKSAAPSGDGPLARFYVGATQNPKRRWQGDEAMVGHGKQFGGKWRCMHIVAARLGPAGAALETSRIAHCLDKYNYRCANVASYSRGLSTRES
eukprot:9471787-Pyramimonas_sp.AAC.1